MLAPYACSFHESFRFSPSTLPSFLRAGCPHSSFSRAYTLFLPLVLGVLCSVWRIRFSSFKGFLPGPLGSSPWSDCLFPQAVTSSVTHFCSCYDACSVSGGALSLHSLLFPPLTSPRSPPHSASVDSRHSRLD